MKHSSTMTSDNTSKALLEADVFDLDFYINIFESIQDGICLLKSGQLVLVNQAFCDIFGQTKDELTNKTFSQLIAQEYTSKLDLALHSIADENQSTQTIDVEIKSSQQNSLWVQAKIKLLKSQQDKIFHVLSLRDISAQKFLIQELELSEQHFKKIIEKLPSIYYRTDSSGVLVKLSPHTCKIMGYEMSELVGQPLSKFYADPEQREENITTILAQKGKPVEVESLLQKSDGTNIWVRTSAYARIDNAGNFLGIEGMSIDITERKILEKNLREMALKDQLTQLINRFGLQEHLEKSLHHARLQGSQFFILFIDLDNFKNVNDNFGHQAGDSYLIEFSKRLKTAFRERDVVSRIGGDEFVILLDGDTLASVITILLARLEKIMQEPFSLKNKMLNFSYSFGSATFPKNGSTVSDLLNHADQQMYQVKSKKKKEKKD